VHLAAKLKALHAAHAKQLALCMARMSMHASMYMKQPALTSSRQPKSWYNPACVDDAGPTKALIT
jgi:hypothetical protein